MFIEHLFPCGDVHNRNSIMVASNAGSIYGSYPFVTLFLDPQDFPIAGMALTPANRNPWHLQAYRGSEDDRTKYIQEDTKFLGEQGSRFPTMPYVVSGS